ncbi:response regulator [Algimonas porphyrae]|uniref:Response regulator n=2 Tax=Algimonas porphyrae TaxID=1128113 RepID=A0ABQ5V042_9PROT|nr:response regulator [Algimonas porphyrae]GLQ20457.1 response regulator [Algimonas porphyrae]
MTEDAADLGNKRIRVLVVEDEPLIAFDLISEIESGNHDVVGQCATAAKAISLAETLKPDIIVMDIGLMGQADGLDAAREIRTRFGIGCIFVSATLDRVAPEQWHEIDPVALIRKPYRDDALDKAISRAVTG